MYSYHISKKAVTITWSDGSSQVIPASDIGYGKACRGIRNGLAESELRRSVDAMRTVAEWSGGAVVAKGNHTFVKLPGGKLAQVSDSLHATLQEFVENEWPVAPFCRFIFRLMQNPSQRSVETLYAYAERYGLSITPDGMLRGYKAITGDWKDKHTRSVDNRIGARPVMDRNKVDDDPDVACSTGSI